MQPGAQIARPAAYALVMEYNEVVPLYGAQFRQHVGTRDRVGCRPWLGYRDDDGYGHFQFRHDGRKYKVRAHRAALMLAGVHVLPQDVLRHSCDNPWCVEPSHILVGAHADNVADRVARGRSARGERNGRARLSDDAVLAVRKDAACFVRQMADRHGVDAAAIRSVLSHKTWRGENLVMELNDQESAVLRILTEVLCLLPAGSRRRVASAFSEMAPDMSEGEEEPARPKGLPDPLAKAVATLRQSPGGMVSADLMQALGMRANRARFAAIMAEGKEAGVIESEGRTRWTRYKAKT